MQRTPTKARLLRIDNGVFPDVLRQNGEIGLSLLRQLAGVGLQVLLKSLDLPLNERVRERWIASVQIREAKACCRLRDRRSDAAQIFCKTFY
jgi:ubiquinone biosynthesis protein UbiJ